jgi:DNA invertase Pin-like site-specific DNA recombinase
MRAYTYLRVSSKGQIEGDGPERQRLACAAFAKAHNLEITAEFFDAHTGTEEHRPAFTQLLCRIDAVNMDVAESHIHCVIVERMDRLARDLMASEFLLRELRNRGIKLFTADQGVLEDTASNDVDPTRILIRQLMAAVAQWEKSTLVKKLRSARIRAAMEGKNCGQKPYGALTEEQEGLRQLVEWNRQGYGLIALADMMNARGYPTRTGVPWTKHTVRGIVARINPVISVKTAAKSARTELANLLAQNDCGGK